MTYSELQDKIKKDNVFDRWMWYILFSLLFPLSLWLFYEMFHDGDKFENRFGTLLPDYGLCILIFALGLYSIFYLIPNRYKILTVSSVLNVEGKNEILKELFQQFKIKIDETTGSYYYYEYGKSVFSYGYNIHIAIDKNGFYLSVQSRMGGSPYGGGGFVDFGGTERFRRKLIIALHTLLLAKY